MANIIAPALLLFGVTPNAAAAVQTPICPPVGNDPLVAAAYKADGVDDATAEASPRVRLRETIAVRITNVSTLLKQLECDEQDGRKRKIILFLDDRPIADAFAYPPTDPARDVMLFPLRRTEGSRDVWAYLLGKPRWRPRPTRVSVGIDDRFAVESQAVVQLETLPHGWFIAWFLILVSAFAALVSRGRKGRMLKDSFETTSVDGPRRAFSLGRVQMAWWFFLVLLAYLFVGMVTGDYSTSITGTALVLLGISVGTTLGASVVDARPREGAAGGTKTVKKRESLRRQIWQFFDDLVTDAEGANLQRVQMVVWTIVLGIIFGLHVYRDLAMPEFDETLLGLMGISSATYVGLKPQEPPERGK